MVRIDQFIKHTQIVKKREDAKKLLKETIVLLNDKIAKPSSKVNDGDIIVLDLNNFIITIKAHVTKDGNKIYVGYEVTNKERKVISCIC